MKSSPEIMLLLGRFWCAILLPTVLTLGSGEARAQESDPVSIELSEEAKQHYRRGMEHYKGGEYEESVVELLAAYSLIPDAMLLYNVSLAYWMAGDVEAARRSALRARADGLPESVSVRNEARLRAFDAVLDAEQIAARLAPEAADPSVVLDESTTAPVGSDPSAQAAAPDVDERSGEGLSALGWTGVATVTLGGLALGGAGIINGQLLQDAAPLRGAAEEGDAATVERFREEDMERLQRKQRTGQVLLVGGALLATMGATFLVVDLLGGERRAASRGGQSSAVLGWGLAPGGGVVVLRADF